MSDHMRVHAAIVAARARSAWPNGSRVDWHHLHVGLLVCCLLRCGLESVSSQVGVGIWIGAGDGMGFGFCFWLRLGLGLGLFGFEVMFHGTDLGSG